MSKQRDEKPDIIAISGLTSTTIREMSAVIQALKSAGLEKVKVIVGGPPITDDFSRSIGADAGVSDAIEGLKICTGWAELHS